MIACKGCGSIHAPNALILNADTQTMLCPLCGWVIHNLPQQLERDLKTLGDLNEQTHVAGFHIHETTAREHEPVQYFIMYGTNAYEQFNPDNIRGVTDASEVAQIMSHFRETGFLRVKKYSYAVMEQDYEVINVMWLHVLHNEHTMYKTHWYQDVPLPKDVT